MSEPQMIRSSQGAPSNGSSPEQWPSLADMDGQPGWRRRWPWTVGAVAITVAVIAAALVAKTSADSQPPAPTTFSITGDITLTSGSFEWSGDVCVGRGGYDDITPGAQVVITDAAGKTVAVTKLGIGKPTMQGDRASACVIPFQVYGVPTGSDFYAIEVTHRGKVQYSRTDLGELVHLSLG